MSAALKWRVVAAGLAAGLETMAASPVFARSYPDKPINVVVPWPPGALDAYIRSISS